MSLLLYNIKELIQVRESISTPLAGAEMNELPTIKNAFLSIKNGLIESYGPMAHCPAISSYDQIIDAQGKMVLPTWCDSHTHIVYAGDRASEFVDRIKGLSYEQIAAKGGGILNSAKMLQNCSEEELYKQAAGRLEEVRGLGTGAIEIKSGYGLTPEAELKMLRVIKRLKSSYDLPIKATFLAAHAVPADYRDKKDEYIDNMLSNSLPIIAREGLADYIDVFCEKNYFSTEEMATILQRGKEFGLTPKVHVNQFNAIGGIKVAIEHEALTVDHLEILEDEDLDALKHGSTIPVALPSCSFFLGIPYTPARIIIDSNLPLAAASDYNPGSTPSGNMSLVLSLCCAKMKMTPEEAINAITINGAFAMGLGNKVGSITVGKLANIIITKPVSSYAYLPYAFGSNHIHQVLIKGKAILNSEV